MKTYNKIKSKQLELICEKIKNKEKLTIKPIITLNWEKESDKMWEYKYFVHFEIIINKKEKYKLPYCNDIKEEKIIKKTILGKNIKNFTFYGNNLEKILKNIKRNFNKKFFELEPKI